MQLEKMPIHFGQLNMKYSKGDIFESNCEALVNAVNCVGKMGKGLALQFKKRFPEMFLDYQSACRAGLRPGTMHVWSKSENPKYIINFPTKDDLSPSKIEYVKDGLVALEKIVKELKIKSIALPALGCGLGGLRWGQVQNLLVEFSKKIPEDCELIVFEPK